MGSLSRICTSRLRIMRLLCEETLTLHRSIGQKRPCFRVSYLARTLSLAEPLFSLAYLTVCCQWTPRAGARSSQTQSERPDSDGPPIAIKKDLRPPTSTPSTCALRERIRSQSYVRGIARSRAHRVFLGFRIRTCAQWPVPPAAVPRPFGNVPGLFHPSESGSTMSAPKLSYRKCAVPPDTYRS